MAQKIESGEGAIVLTVETGFVAIEEIEAAGVVGEVTEGEAGDGGGIEGLEVRTDAEAVFLNGDVGAFDVPDAAETPAADGHILDEVALDLVGGMEQVPHGLGEPGELGLGFAIKGDGPGEKAVTQGVAGGVALAGLGDGTF